MFRKRFIYFVMGAKEKLQNTPQFEMDFEFNFATCSSDFTCLLGLTFSFLNKNSKEITSPFIVLSFFIHNISFKPERETTSLLCEDVGESSVIHFLNTFRYEAKSLCF